MKVYVKYYYHYDESEILGVFDEQGKEKDFYSYLPLANKKIQEKIDVYKEKIKKYEEEQVTLKEKLAKAVQESLPYTEAVQNVKKSFTVNNEEYRKAYRAATIAREPYIEAIHEIEVLLNAVKREINNNTNLVLDAFSKTNEQRIEQYLIENHIEYTEFELNKEVAFPL